VTTIIRLSRDREAEAKRGASKSAPVLNGCVEFADSVSGLINQFAGNKRMNFSAEIASNESENRAMELPKKSEMHTLRTLNTALHKSGTGGTLMASDTKKNKIPGIRWMPPLRAKVSGTFETIYEPCYCKELTRNGKPAKNCRVCGGAGGVTLLFSSERPWLLVRVGR
jgi:hypothetical protein